MADDLLIKTASNKLAKALPLGNSLNGAFVPFVAQNGIPFAAGTYVAGAGGMLAPNRVKVYPYCEGAAGSTFSVRVYGWDHISDDPRYFVFVPPLLTEFLCVSCDSAGPGSPGGPGVSPYVILDSERFCDTISLTQGSVGWMGEVNSCPGSGCVGFVMVDLRGCKFFAFDFANVDPVTLSMNALFATA